MRIVMLYTDIESFNFFVDQMDREFRLRGHETFIFDVLHPYEETPHSYARFVEFVSSRVDMAVCFDGMCVREELLIDTWDAWGTVVVDILMDPPFRFHRTLERHSRNYVLFCCDRDHVTYVKRYFAREVSHVAFMPHVGAMPDQDAQVIPYEERKFDILFTGTYYRPQDRLSELFRMCEENVSMKQLYQMTYRNMTDNSELTMEQALLLAMRQGGWTVPEETLKLIFAWAENVDWAIRMYQRERVVSVLAEAGFELYLLGRGWENHSASGYPNVHRIDGRVPYAQTLPYMADAKINLNVMPWFKSGAHDRIFNTLLQHSLSLTDSSSWIEENFTDGRDIALYDLKHLYSLPAIAERLLHHPDEAEAIIQNGYDKVVRNYTWSNCADRILEAFASFTGTGYIST